MTLDENIEHFETMARLTLPHKGRDYQLAEWLKNYKRLLEQEPILDKIRAEIEQVKSIMNDEIINHDRKDLINFVNGLNQSLVIIDKYKAESEV